MVLNQPQTAMQRVSGRFGDVIDYVYLTCVACVALVPKLTAQNEIASDNLVVMTVNEMKLERQLIIIYRRNFTLSHAAEAFLKIAKEFGKTLTK